MRTLDHVVAQGMPETFAAFICEACRIPPEVVHWLPASELPERDRRLLMHSQDMTSTLAAFHGSPLHVEVFQQRRLEELYLREVFLRTQSDAIVEYGVIAIALEQFTAPQQAAIQAGQMPLGGVLHQFQIPFVSAPLGFVSVSAAGLVATPLGLPPGSRCFGRFNRLAKPTGEVLAWILEILPPA